MTDRAAPMAMPTITANLAAANLQVYSRPQIVDYYAHLTALQAPEAQLIQDLAPKLAQMRMLDLGVGAGRTTRHFAPLVQEYVGVDYSPAMIAACQQTYGDLRTQAGHPPNFVVADVRSLESLAEQPFDLILFSFNGLDFIPHAERLQVLQTLYQLCQPGGVVCFSSHNLQAIESHFRWRAQWRLNPLSTYVNLIMSGVWRWFNRGLSLSQLQAASFAIVRDESHNFQLYTYYIRPQAQIEQLQALGFEAIQILTWREGHQLYPARALDLLPEKQLEALTTHRDPWLYYQCRVPRH
jgi:ubiquinone/menaquinone biosynthesis C-methylase UbiE